jgi:hypothetical protein
MHVAPLAAAHTTWKQSEQSGHAATGWMRGSNEPSGKIRSLGIDCCARAASGHASSRAAEKRDERAASHVGHGVYRAMGGHEHWAPAQPSHGDHITYAWG